MTFSNNPKPALPLINPRNSTVVNTKILQQRNMTLDMLREQNICFKCYEKYHPRHQCKNRAINNLEAKDFVDANDKIKEQAIELEAEAHDQGEVKLNAIMGHGKASSTIRIEGRVKGLKVMVLID